MATQALRKIGNDNATEEELNIILALLKKENKRNLKHDISLAPLWIRKIMKIALDE